MKAQDIFRGALSIFRGALTLGMVFCLSTIILSAQQRMSSEGEQSAKDHPWMNASLSPDERAEMVLKQLTLDEKIVLLHGERHAGLGHAAAQ